MRLLEKRTEHLHTYAPLEFDRKTMKSSSGKRPPDEAHGPGKEAIRPLHPSEFENSATFRQTFSHFCSFGFKISRMFYNCCPNFNNFDEKCLEIHDFYGDENLRDNSDYQIY